MRTIGLLSLFFLIFVSCKEKRDHTEENILAEINGNFLYREELQSVLPFGLSKDDSLLFAENYIRIWVKDVLLYDKAKENIQNNNEVERLIENYRKSLIVHSYQQELINQRLSTEITEQEITDFYENNKELFITERPLIKGLFMKVPLTAPRINDVRKWYKTETYEAVENLEKYSLLNAVGYGYFYDKWTTVSDILGKIPLKVDDPESYIEKNRQIELQDTAYYYFLNVTEYLNIGDEEPYDFAHDDVRKMLVNVRKIDFIKEVKNDLYREALRKNKIKYNY